MDRNPFQQVTILHTQQRVTTAEVVKTSVCIETEGIAPSTVTIGVRYQDRLWDNCQFGNHAG